MRRRRRCNIRAPVRSKWKRRKRGRGRRSRQYNRNSGARSGPTERAVLHDHGAGSGGGQQKRRGRNERAAGPDACLYRAARRCVDHRKFQGNATGQYEVGQRVTIPVDAFGRDYQGKVDSIAGATGAQFSLLPPENATGNYVKVVQRVPVKIVLDPGQNNDHLLRLGMSVEPKV